MKAVRHKLAPEDWRDAGSVYDRAGKRGRLWFLLLSFIVPPKHYKLRPTMPGYFLLVVAVAMGGAAYNSSSNILFMALSLVLGLLIMSGLMSHFNFNKIDWCLAAPDHLRAGEEAWLQVRVRNRKRWMPSFAFWFEARAGERDKAVRLIAESEVAAGRELQLPWHFTPGQRGPLSLHVSGIISQYPFGFLRKRIGLPIVMERLVWPARIGYRLRLGAGRERRRGMGSRNRLGDGEDLAGVRVYREGDELRRIHWKASAKSQDLLVKEFDREGGEGIHVSFNTSRHLWREPEVFEKALGLLGSLIEDTYRRGALISVRIDENEPTRVQHIRDVHAVMAHLAVLSWGRGPFENPHAPLGNEVSLRPGEQGQIQLWRRNECVGETVG